MSSTDTALNWVDAAAADDVPADDVVGIEVQGRDIAFYGTEEGVFATDNQCTHGAARLCDGFLLGTEIECPLHQGRFDVRSGQAMCEPLTENVRAYPVKIENGRVWVALD